MKNIIALALSALICFPLSAQSTDWQAKYNALVSIVGISGVGIENVLNNWEKDEPDRMEMLVAKFQYYALKSQYKHVVTKDTKKYMGQECIMELKDSLGKPVYYFQETTFDDSLVTISYKYIDKAIAKDPNRLDLKISKITSLLTYEKDSPDMTWSALSNLIDDHCVRHLAWDYPGSTIDDDTFISMVQEYGYTFFKIASPQSLSAFLKLNQKMAGFFPAKMDFINDIGSYYVVTKDYKTAFKYFNQVLKKEPDNHNAITNCVNVAIHQNDKKLLKKYLPMMVKYGTEAESRQAKVRLDALK